MLGPARCRMADLAACRAMQGLCWARALQVAHLAACRAMQSLCWARALQDGCYKGHSKLHAEPCKACAGQQSQPLTRVMKSASSFTSLGCSMVAGSSLMACWWCRNSVNAFMHLLLAFSVLVLLMIFTSLASVHLLLGPAAAWGWGWGLLLPGG